MRLLSTKPGRLQLAEFYHNIPPYAILSHTWGDEEVSMQELGSAESEKKRGFAKILSCCRQALSDSLEWVWIDTCCINKTSSAELSEAINSMYAWYRDAEICYAYLEDVPPAHDLNHHQKFLSARWFTRGWCLQELIAPCNVEFYAADWTEIGTRSSLCGYIMYITGIPDSVLLRRSLDECSIAQKMSWASERKTTRIEDEAYCLLGIFGVHMPLLYGEGNRAFFRLQEQIIRQTEDYSFLLWTEVPVNKYGRGRLCRSPVFAPEPACFHRDGPCCPQYGHLSYEDISRAPGDGSTPAVSHPSLRLAWRWDPCQMTSRGLLVSLPSRPVRGGSRAGEVMLWTGYMYQQSLVCVTLIQEGNTPTQRYVRAPDRHDLRVHLVDARDSAGFELTPKYLSSSPDVWVFDGIGGIVSSLRKKLPSVFLDIDVVLSSPYGSNRRIALARPSRYRFERVSDEPGKPRFAPDQTEIWRTVYEEAAYKVYKTLMLPFTVYSPGRHPPQETVSVSFTLYFRPGRSICAFQHPANHPDIALLSSRTIPASDRQEQDLQSGGVVSAAIKSVTQPSGRMRFTLRASLLPELKSAPEPAAKDDVALAI